MLTTRYTYNPADSPIISAWHSMCHCVPGYTNIQPEHVPYVSYQPRDSTMQQHSASPGGTTSWQTSDVARGAGLGLILHSVEPMLAVVSERLWVSDLVLLRRGKSDRWELDNLPSGGGGGVPFLLLARNTAGLPPGLLSKADEAIRCLDCAHPQTAQPDPGLLGRPRWQPVLFLSVLAATASGSGSRSTCSGSA